jgi:glycerol-3-phosphate O-acyltransferase
VLFLSRLFKYEFRFRSNKAFEEVLEETLVDMVAASELVVDTVAGAEPDTTTKQIGFGAGRLGWNGRKWILTYAAMIRNFVEGYRIVVRALGQLLDQPVAEKDLVKNALELGQRMYHAGELERMESISKPMFENALLALQDQGCIRTTQGKLTLTPQYATEGSLLELEAKVASYLQQELDH